MTATPITREDLAPALASHRGHDALRAALAGATAPPAFLSLFARFINFNAAFGAGLANLAGEIAARQRLFVDRSEPVRILADRAADVAADFFHGAIDEFDDRLTPWRDTHRTLAQATLKGIGAYFGHSPEQLNGVLALNEATQVAIERVWIGYGVAAALDEPSLFAAMGFHAGSEVLADQEFTIIDQTLRKARPEMVAALEAMKIEQGGERHNAYYWIRIHTSVEADHFDAALAGVNKALRYYAGEAAPSSVREWILGGFAQFLEVQGEFMAALGQGLP